MSIVCDPRLRPLTQVNETGDGDRILTEPSLALREVSPWLRHLGSGVLGPAAALTMILIEDDRQILTLLTKEAGGERREKICPVLYVALRGAYGAEALF